MGRTPHAVDALLAEGEWIHRLGRRLAGETAGADAAQEALTLALERPPDADVRLRSWLAGALRNVLRQERRAFARRRAREERAARPEALEAADEPIVRIELYRRLLEHVRGLDEPLRSTITARFLENLTPKEIAARHGVPVKTVYTRLDRALALLRERLDREHEGSRAAWAAVFAPAGGALSTSAKTLVPLAVMGTLKWTAVAAAAIALGFVAHRFLPSREPADGSPSTAARPDVAIHVPSHEPAQSPDVTPTREALAASAAASATPIAEDVPLSRPFLGAVVVELVFPDGTPAPGALVRVTPTIWGSDDSYLRQYEEQQAELRSYFDSSPSVMPYPGTGQQRLRADASGRVYVDADATGELNARAMRGGVNHRGELQLGPAALGNRARPAATYRLELAPRMSADVVVVDPSGAPAAHVLVTVRGEGDGRALAGAVTDRDGRAVIETIPADVERSTLVAFAIVPGATDVSAPLAADGDTRLVLPPTGAIVAELAIGGAGWERIALGGVDSRAPSLVVGIDDRRAVFPHVALGGTFTLGASGSFGRHEETVEGPARAGETVVYRFGAAAMSDAWRVVLTDEFGAPWVARAVEVTTETRIGGMPGRMRVPRITDSDGGLWLDLSKTPARSTVAFLAFDDDTAGRPRRHRRGVIEFDAATPTPARDLGTVALVPRRLLARGVVMGAGAPLPYARVRAYPATALERARKGWAADAETRTDAAGRFALFGDIAEDEIALVASSTGRRATEPLVTRTGDIDLVLELEGAAYLDARVRMPDGVPVGVAVAVDQGHTRVRLGSVTPARIVPSEPTRIPPRISSADPRELVFAADDLRAGSWTLVVISLASGDEVVRQPIVLVEGERTDVGVLDVSDLLPLLDVVVTSDGEPVSSFSVAYPDAPDAPDAPDGATRHSLSSPARVLAPRFGGTIQVSAKGHSPATVAVQGERVEVALERARPVTLRLPAGYPAPARTREHHLSLRRLSGDAAQTSLPFPYLEPSNEYRLELGGPGRFRATVLHVPDSGNRVTTIFGTQGQRAHVEFEVTSEHLAGAPIELAFDLDEWTKAIADAR